MTVLHVACIGSRDLTEGQLAVCRKLGAHLVNCGHFLHSGNAPGADQAFASGGNQVNATYVCLHLPWPRFEGQAILPDNRVESLEDHAAEILQLYEQIAERHHGAWKWLKQGGRKLMTRNSAIMLPLQPHYRTGRLAPAPVDLCLAWPIEKKLRNGKKTLGGTGQGMRIAAHEGIRLIDLRHQTESDLYELCEELTQKGKE